MRILLLLCVALAVSVASAPADSITLNAFHNNTPATVTFDDGAGHSGTISTLLSQFNVTFSGAGAPITFDTFSVDPFHTVTVGQTYAVTPRDDLDTAFVSRMAYIFQNFGLQDLTNAAIQAAAIQIALWNLSLSNHNPTSFGMDADGSYSSGDENVFSVSFGSNPDASQIAALTNQYLNASIGAVTPGAWLDAAAAGNDANRGASVLRPVPGASSGLMIPWASADLPFGNGGRADRDGREANQRCAPASASRTNADARCGSLAAESATGAQGGEPDRQQQQGRRLRH